VASKSVKTLVKGLAAMLVAVCALAAADAWPLFGLGDWDTWSTWDEYNACLLRGDPVVEPRIADVPVRLPHPSRPWPGSIYALQESLSSSAFSE